MNSGQTGALRRRVLLSGTMLVAAVAGYGRRAYGACLPSGGSTYQCSGANAATQTINANNAIVSTVAGFSVNTAAGNGITITGDGALSYTDTNASLLTATAGTTLAITSGADFGGTPGSITINTNGVLSGANYGILARNYGTGALTVTANGNVTATAAFSRGIYARNYSGTDLSVTTAAGTTVSGTSFGIRARNAGTGATTVTANGNITAGTGISAYSSTAGTDVTVTTGAGTTIRAGEGIDVISRGTGATTVTANGDVISTNLGIFAVGAGTGLSVTTAAGTTVSGGFFGIYTFNRGTGALTIIANGNVTATGATSKGIYARNYSGTGTDLSVTTGAGTTVSGTNFGIRARNGGTGATTITANGNITATAGTGIFADSAATGTDLTVTTGAGTTIRGNEGIHVVSRGTGATTITANGDVIGSIVSEGIYAGAAGTNLSVTTAAGTTVSGRYGIFATSNYSAGALTITANGDVTGLLHDGIKATTTGNAIGITVAATGRVTSNGAAATDFGIETKGGPATVTVAGTVNGGAGGAIKFDQTTAFANRLELVTGAVINGNVLGGLGTDTLGLSGAGSGSFNAGQLSSFEAGEKTGSGAWTLTGSNTGIAAFSVGAGALFVNGSLSNAGVTVNGGTLAGTGTIGSVTVSSGGTFAPGSGVAGTSMSITGSATFAAGSIYQVYLGSTASFANVGGTASLTGGTVGATLQSGGTFNKTYTILTSAGLGGTQFTGVSGPNIAATLTYTATDVMLALNATLGGGTSLDPGQQAVAGALNSYFNSGAAVPAGFLTVFGLTDGALRNALTQLSGQPGASTAQTGITGVGQFVNAIFDGAFDDNSGPGGASGFAAADEASAYAPKNKVAREATDAFAKAMPVKAVAPSFASRWNVWATAYGGNSRVNGDATAGTSTTTSRIFGTAVGATYRFTPDTQAGFALGGAGSSFSLDGGFGGGKADVFNAAFYAKHNIGAAYVAGLLGYSWQDTTTDRTVAISGADQLHASFKAQALAARLEGGWRYATPMIGVTPYAALQSTTFYLPAYGETAASSSGTFALSYASKAVTATRSELGAKLDEAMLVQGGVFTLKARTAWAHDWNTDRSVIATFQTLPGATFTVNGAQPSADAALASLGAEMKWHNGWTLAASFEGEFSNVTRSYAGKGALRYAW